MNEEEILGRIISIFSFVEETKDVLVGGRTPTILESKVGGNKAAYNRYAQRGTYIARRYFSL